MSRLVGSGPERWYSYNSYFKYSESDAKKNWRQCTSDATTLAKTNKIISNMTTISYYVNTFRKIVNEIMKTKGNIEFIATDATTKVKHRWRIYGYISKHEGFLNVSDNVFM